MMQHKKKRKLGRGKKKEELGLGIEKLGLEEKIEREQWRNNIIAIINHQKLKNTIEKET